MNNIVTVVGSFLFFLFFDKKLSPSFSSISFPKYRKLTLDQKNIWNARNSSSLHATVVTLTCMYVILFDEKVKKNHVWGFSKVSETNIAVAVGYLLSDLYLLATTLTRDSDTFGFVVHHLSAIYAYQFALRYGILIYFANLRLLAEMSTPFVNIRWALSIFDNKDSKWYFYNGLTMTFCFFISRILLMPYFYYLVYEVVFLEEYKSVSFLIHVSWISVCIVLDTMNIFWFGKMLKGITKHIRKIQKVQKTSNGVAPMLIHGVETIPCNGSTVIKED
uniref:Transmembrane protein 56-B n=1 Tax=Ciona intestinalis TaxID=7719 RepID=H2XUX5_CIOIN|nr:transmembrane protein 56-B isoform X1 [Ciona intestinalis]|eukprot:XP_002131806.1 transmembrane protein 56-B isoform X1 [Ciona intestinalis]